MTRLHDQPVGPADADQPRPARYSSPIERYSLFGKANFKLNDHVEAFTQVNFVNTTNRQVLQPSGAVGGFGAIDSRTATTIYGPSLNVFNGTRARSTRRVALYGLNCPATGGCTKSQAFPVSPSWRAAECARSQCAADGNRPTDADAHVRSGHRRARSRSRA